jgi:hypothetical protein
MKMIRQTFFSIFLLGVVLAFTMRGYGQVNTTQRRPDAPQQARFAPSPPNGPPDPCTDPRLPCPIDNGVILLMAAAIGVAVLRAKNNPQEDRSPSLNIDRG